MTVLNNIRDWLMGSSNAVAMNKWAAVASMGRVGWQSTWDMNRDPAHRCQPIQSYVVRFDSSVGAVEISSSEGEEEADWQQSQQSRQMRQTSPIELSDDEEPSPLRERQRRPYAFSSTRASTGRSGSSTRGASSSAHARPTAYSTFMSDSSGPVSTGHSAPSVYPPEETQTNLLNVAGHRNAVVIGIVRKSTASALSPH